MTVLYSRVPLDDDGDFNAFTGRLLDTEILSIVCDACGYSDPESKFVTQPTEDKLA
jgi:hypothetical protein